MLYTTYYILYTIYYILDITSYILSTLYYILYTSYDTILYDTIQPCFAMVTLKSQGPGNIASPKQVNLGFQPSCPNEVIPRGSIPGSSKNQGTLFGSPCIQELNIYIYMYIYIYIYTCSFWGGSPVLGDSRLDCQYRMKAQKACMVWFWGSNSLWAI